MANPAMVTVMIFRTIFRIRGASNEGQPETLFGISGRAQPTSHIPRMQPSNSPIYRESSVAGQSWSVRRWGNHFHALLLLKACGPVCVSAPHDCEKHLRVQDFSGRRGKNVLGQND